VTAKPQPRVETEPKYGRCLVCKRPLRPNGECLLPMHSQEPPLAEVIPINSKPQVEGEIGGDMTTAVVDMETGELERRKATGVIPTMVEIAPSLLVAFANLASTDEERPILNGVQLSFQRGSVRVSATDSFVAGTYREIATDEELVRGLRCLEPLSIIVPIHTLMPLLKLKLKDENKESLPVELMATGKETQFRRGPWSVVLPNIEGDFPDIMKLLDGKEPEPAELIGMAKPLGSFIKFAESVGCSTAMHLTLFGSNKVIGVRFCDSVLAERFMGAVMPIRTDEDMQLNLFGLPEWLEVQMAEHRREFSDAD
jgi:hypothetical protein